MESSSGKETRISVLYVDDEPALLDIMKTVLERSGLFTVATTKDASDALRMLDLHRYDAIVSDYQMPGMDGIELLKIVRDRFGSIPFILFTGKGREEVVIEAINNGADFYLQKGGDMKSQYTELSNKIQYAVSRRRVELDLRESEERYRNVVEDQTELICRFLPDGTHVFVNEAYCRYFGISREEIIGSRFRPKLPREDRDAVTRLIETLTPDHPLGTIDQRIVMRDGSIRWQRWVDRAIFLPGGTLKEFQSVGRDITELKTAEQALRQNEEKYRAVFENTGTAMVTIEEDQVISLANDEFARLSGYSRDEIEGKKRWAEFVVPEDMERMVEQHRLRRQNHDKALTHYEFRFITKSGEIRDIYLSIDMIPGTKKSIASLQDVSRWKNTQKALVESEERFRQLFSRMPSGVAIYEAVDDGGDFIIKDFNTNAESIEHVRKDEVVGRRVTEVFPGVKGFGLFSVFQRVWRTGTPEYFPKAIYRDARDPGSWRENWIYRLPTGEVVAIYNDITDRKLSEEALKQANKQLNLLSSITRHDILNQLLSLRAYIQVSRGLLENKPALAETFDKEEKIAGIIEEEIIFTRDYQEMGVKKPSWQNLNAVINQVIPQLPRNDVSITVDRSDIEVFADQLLEKVFFNLLDNALHYGGSTLHEIKIASQVGEESLTIICEDDGTGIRPEDRPYLFTRGFGRHTGLGLFLSKEILAITGMTIRENGEPGKGARFEIVVPRECFRISGGNAGPGN